MISVTGVSVRVEGERIAEIAEDGALLSPPDAVDVIDARGGGLLDGYGKLDELLS